MISKCCELFNVTLPATLNLIEWTFYLSDLILDTINFLYSMISSFDANLKYSYFCGRGDSFTYYDINQFKKYLDSFKYIMRYQK